MGYKRVNKTILVIDDSPMDIMVVTNLLRDEYTILAANNGCDGLETALGQLPDLLILDVEMPGMNGFEVIEKLKKNKKTKKIPILLTTGLSDKETAERGYELGISHYIKKPIDVVFIKKCIRVLLGEQWEE